MFRRISPFDDFSNIFRSFDNLVRLSSNQPWNARPLLSAGEGKALAEPESHWHPAVETFTREGDLVLRAELPGVDPKDVDVTVEKGRLILRGEKREEKLSDDDSVYVRELSYGRFERVFLLPEGVKAEQIKASFRNGLLEVSLPAKALAPESRQIPVEAAEARDIQVA